MISRVKGTQDFCDLTSFNTIVDCFKKHAALYSFSEIATPLIEPFELFHRSLGEFTDVVSKEMFFIQTHDPKERICLRPEATASTVRAFIENGIQKSPWKVFSYGPMFRYERPQKGRFRQFHQINMELIGTKNTLDDVQLLYMLDRYFNQKLFLTDYTLSLNYLGCTDDRKQYVQKLTDFLLSNAASEICATCKVRATHNSMRVFDCKNEQCQTIYKNASVITDCLCSSCADEWQEIQKNLLALSVSFVYNPHLVRGLDYYNKTVFEFSSTQLGAQNAFCGGGRYDSLVKEIGGKQDQPAIGAALGIERLLLLLEAQKNPLLVPKITPLVYIIPLSAAQQAHSLIIASTLRAHDIRTDINFSGSSLKSMMRAADKANAHYVIVIGEDEQKNSTVMVKDMAKGTQSSIVQSKIVDFIKESVE